MKIYKAKNTNRKTIGVLFVLQVVFGTLPAVLLIIFALTSKPPDSDNSTYIEAYVSAAAIVLCGFAYTILGRKYNILISGLKGEKALRKIAKKHRGEYSIFLNIPVRYKQNRSEIDMLMVGEKGILIVEAKNHSGTISGEEKDELWTQFKHYRDGKSTESEMKNPFRQLSRQREILKNILRSNGYDVWIDGVVFFSNPFVRLNLTLSEKSFTAKGDKELNSFISAYKSPKLPDKKSVDEIVELLKNML